MRQQEIINALQGTQHGRRYIAVDCDGWCGIVEVCTDGKRFQVNYTGWTVSQRQIDVLQQKQVVVKTRIARDIDRHDDLVLYGLKAENAKIIRDAERYAIKTCSGIACYGELQSCDRGYVLTVILPDGMRVQTIRQQTRDEIVYGHVLHGLMRVMTGIDVRNNKHLL